jgi:NADPH-dependent ferric siderophore reductase
MSERRPFPLHTGVAEVVAVTDVTPAMRRVTLEDPLFGPSLGVEQAGELLTLGWANDGAQLVPPAGGWRYVPWALKARGKQHWRNFTIRTHRPGANAVDVDFFLHGEAGPASRWALRAKVGDQLGFAGPRVHWEPAPEAEWVLLVADETGLPALLAILESLAPGRRTIAVAEVAGAQERQQPEVTAGVEWHWLHRGDRPPGTTTLLRAAVAGLELPAAPGQAWGGGESRAMRELRRDLSERRSDLKLHMLGYWKLK